MLWKLHSKQVVSYHRGTVTFNHGGRKIYLNKEQFLNFHDACQVAKLTTLRIHLLIDRNIWLHYGNSVSIVIHDRGNRFFRFSPNSWRKYISVVHRQILHLVKNGEPSCGERSLHHGKQFSFRSSMAALQSGRDEVFQREATHVEMDTTNKWKDSSDISKSENTNNRKSEQYRGGRYARSHSQGTTPSPGRTDTDNHFTSSMHDDSECSASS